MHFCKVAADCFKNYDFNSNNKVAEVIAYGKVLTDGTLYCTDKLEFIQTEGDKNKRWKMKEV